MRLKHLVILAIIVLAVAGAVGYRFYLIHTKASEEKPRAAAVAVEAIMPVRRAMQDMRLFTGTLSARSQYEAAAKVGGRVIDMAVGFSDSVEIGQLLAQIDPEDYRRELEQAEAACEITSAQLREAQVTLALRKKEYDRQRELGRVTSKAALDSAESAYLAQEATVMMKAAELKKQQASLRTAQTRLADTTILQKTGDDKSRFFVADTYADPGTLVKENEKLIRIVDIATMKANIYVIERDYSNLSIGQSAVVTTDAYSGKKFSAVVTQISQEIQKNTRQARVDITIPNPDLLLKPGMFVRVNIEFARRDDTQAVPRSAVLKRNGQNVVFLLDAESGRALMTPVVTGISENDNLEIISPQLDKPVITLGNHLLAHEMPVRVPEQFRKNDDKAE